MMKKGNEEKNEPYKFDKFEKLDRKVEEKINEVETLGHKNWYIRSCIPAFSLLRSGRWSLT